MNDVYFFMAKMGWKVVSPSGFLSISILSILILVLLNRQCLAKRISVVVLPFFIAVSFFPVGEWLFYLLEKRYPPNIHLPKQVDGILILGGSGIPASSEAWGQPQLRSSAERDLVFMMLARRFPDAKLVFTGGSPWMNGMTESEVAKQLYLGQGIETDRIVFESKSRNTRENAQFSKELVQPQKTEIWLLITSAFHMPRAQGVFCDVHWNTVPVPVDYQSNPNSLIRPQWKLSVNLRVLEFALREWVGLTVQYMLGDGTELIPRPCLASGNEDAHD